MVEYALINSLVTGVSFVSSSVSSGFQQMVNGLMRDPNAGWGLLMIMAGVAWWITRRRV
jgi:hypothetical protein